MWLKSIFLGLHTVLYTVYGRMITAHWRLRFDCILYRIEKFSEADGTVRYGTVRYGTVIHTAVHPYCTATGIILQTLNSLKYFQGNKKAIELFRVEINALSSSTSRYPSSRRNIPLTYPSHSLNFVFSKEFSCSIPNQKFLKWHVN